MVVDGLKPNVKIVTTNETKDAWTCIPYLARYLFALDENLLLPVSRRRVTESGLLGGVAIPLILACIGFDVLMVEIYELRFQEE